MEQMMYTIVSDGGFFVEKDPEAPERRVGVLFYDPVLAAHVIDRTADPSCWKVVPIGVLDAWLEALLAEDITHICEHLTLTHSTEKTTASWLLMLRAQQAGREYRSRRS